MTFYSSVVRWSDGRIIGTPFRAQAVVNQSVTVTVILFYGGRVHSVKLNRCFWSQQLLEIGNIRQEKILTATTTLHY